MAKKRIAPKTVAPKRAKKIAAAPTPTPGQAPAPAPEPVAAPAPKPASNSKPDPMIEARRIANEILLNAKTLDVPGTIFELPSYYLPGRRDIFVLFGKPNEEMWGCALAIRNKGEYDHEKSMALAKQLQAFVQQLEIPLESDFNIIDNISHPEDAPWLDVMPRDRRTDPVPEALAPLVDKLLIEEAERNAAVAAARGKPKLAGRRRKAS